MKEEYDVLVVGAGPGGAMAAKTAAEAGLSVCLLEKRPAPGAPVRCAEGIGEDLISEFFDKLDPKWICSKINSAKIVAPDGKAFYLNPEMAGNEVGYVLDRKFFDRDLVWKAVDAGAEVYVKASAVDAIMEDGKCRGAVVNYMGKMHNIRAKVTIAADGVESKFVRYCGIDSSVPLSLLESGAQYLMTDIDIEPGVTVFYLGRDVAPCGYVWIFPKGERTANVGIGITSNQAKNGMHAIDYLDKFVKANFPDGKIVELITGGVTISEPLKETYADNLIAVGDAGRFSDPITGGGIYNAMYTGRLAGQIAAKCIKNGDTSKEALKEYQDIWKVSRMGKALERNYQIMKVFVELSDEDLNKVLNSANNMVMKEFSTLTLIKELMKANPKILKSLVSLRKYFE